MKRAYNTAEHAGYALPATLFVLAVLSRLPFTDTVLYNMDSIHFALALDKFDVALHQPHPPGYYLYVMMGRLMRLATGDSNGALIAISVIFSGLSVLLVYNLGCRVFGRSEGLAAALIAVTSPLLWFHGIVALSYAVECFASLAIAWLCYRIIKGEERLVLASAVLLGLAGGVRQTTLVFLLPLWLYSIRCTGIKRISLAMAALALSFASWFLPLLHATGGYLRYAEASEALMHRAVWNGISVSSILNNLRIQIFWVVWGLLAALAPSLIALVSRIRRRAGKQLSNPDTAFFLMWLVPSLLFYIVVMSKEQNPGYSLVYMPALYILAGRAVVLEAGRLGERLSGHPVLALVLAAILVVNTLAFFFMKFDYSYRGVRESRQLASTYLDGLKSNFAPDKTVVIGWEHIFVSYRHVAYYLPRYLVYYIPRLGGPGGYYLRCRDRNTSMAREINIPDGTKYVVYFVPNTRGLGEDARKLGARTLPIGGGFRMIYFSYDVLRQSGQPIDKALLGIGYSEDI